MAKQYRQGWKPASEEPVEDMLDISARAGILLGVGIGTGLILSPLFLLGFGIIKLWLAIEWVGRALIRFWKGQRRLPKTRGQG